MHKINTENWQILQKIIQKIDSKGYKKLSNEEQKQLFILYEQCVSDLAYIKSTTKDEEQIKQLSSLISNAYHIIYSEKKNLLKELIELVFIAFPYYFRKYFIIFISIFLVFWGTVFISYYIVRNDNSVIEHYISSHKLDIIRKGHLHTEKIRDASPLWASFILTNNWKVCLIWIVLGATLGLGTLALMINQAMDFGFFLAAYHKYNLLNEILGFIFPHGVLEFTAMFISGTISFLFAFTILKPHPYTIRDALKNRRKDFIALIIGVVFLLIIAAMLEGFFSPSEIHYSIKYIVSFIEFILLSLFLYFGGKHYDNTDRI